MTRIFVCLLLGLAGVLLQSAFLPRLIPGHIRPDFILILTIYLAITEAGYLRGALAAYLLGRLLDVFAGIAGGFFGTALLVTFLLIRGASARFNTENSFLLLLMVFAGTLVEGLVMIFPLSVLLDAGPLWLLILEGLPAQALLNTAFALLFLQGGLWLQRRFFPRRQIPGFRHLDSRYEP